MSTLRLSPLALGRMAFGIDAAVDRGMVASPVHRNAGADRQEDRHQHTRPCSDDVRRLASARDDETPQRFAGALARRRRLPRRRSDRRVNICPLCLAKDRRGYVRLLWMNGWAGVCPKHRTVTDGTLSVLPMRAARRWSQRSPPGRPDYLPALRAHRSQALRATRPSNGTSASGNPGRRQAIGPNRASRRRHARLVDHDGAGRRASRHGLDRHPAKTIATGCLLASPTISISANTAMRIAWASNYGGLVILAWLLDDLATRLPATIAILHAPRLDRLLARVPDLSSEDERSAARDPRSGNLLPSPKGRRSWRNWIETLPETGKFFANELLSERYRLRRQRLFALAALRDGATVEAAAETVGVTARTLYRWLQQGATNGLEAALERPRRRSQLSGAQAEALGNGSPPIRRINVAEQ